MEEKEIIQNEGVKNYWLVYCIVALIAFGVLLIFMQFFEGNIRFQAFFDPFYGSLLSIAIIIFPLFFCWWLAGCQLVVTNKRVYGKAAFGKRVDLPLDSISAVGTGILKSISVNTASSAIKFSLIKNRDEIHAEISKLLLERQEKEKNVATTVKQEIPQSSADEIKKYKELLDAGIITQEEFDAKKKQLLDL